MNKLYHKIENFCAHYIYISKLSLRLSVLNATYVLFLRNTKADFPLKITSKMAQN